MRVLQVMMLNAEASLFKKQSRTTPGKTMSRQIGQRVDWWGARLSNWQHNYCCQSPADCLAITCWSRWTKNARSLIYLFPHLNSSVTVSLLNRQFHVITTQTCTS